MLPSHLTIAHAHWRRWVSPHHAVIDATCGNGKDAELLCTLAGTVWGFDIQEAAIAATRARCGEQIRLLCRCHSQIDLIPDQRVRLVVYNLGYLPGGDKSITTRTETTLTSLQKALRISDAISLICYPGHIEGEEEKAALLPFLENLSLPWQVTAYPGSRPDSPIFFWLERSGT